MGRDYPPVAIVATFFLAKRAPGVV